MTDTTSLLLDAAEHRIRSKGYNAVSFRELADTIGIKSASVHYHFARKEDLGVALVKRYSERFFEALRENSSSANGWPEHLDAFCATYRSALTASDSVCLCGVLGAETAGLPRDVSEAVKSFFNANIEWLERAMSDDMTKDLRHQRAAHVVATLQGAMMLAINLGDVGLFDVVVRNLSETALTD